MTERGDLEALEHGPLFLFSDWPNGAVPDHAAGVYTVWERERFIYAGMAGRGLTAEEIARRRAEERSRTGGGLWGRLNSHASGRRSGDQFCVYVCDRFVMRSLTTEQIDMIGAGDASLDRLVRDFVRERLAYRFVECTDGWEAAGLERDVRAGALEAGRPILNPL